MAELLPCPFCGRQAELRYTENEESAIKHWNKRTPKERGGEK